MGNEWQKCQVAICMRLLLKYSIKAGLTFLVWLPLHALPSLKDSFPLLEVPLAGDDFALRQDPPSHPLELAPFTAKIRGMGEICGLEEEE